MQHAALFLNRRERLGDARRPSLIEPHAPSATRTASPYIVGMLKAEPLRTPRGQRAVTVFKRV